MGNDIDSFLVDAVIARDHGDYSRAITLASRVISDVVACFGKSIEAAKLPYFLAETGYLYFLHGGLSSASKVEVLKWASGHAGLVVMMLEERGQKDSLLYLQSLLLFARIVLADDGHNLPDAGAGWPNIDRAGMVKFATKLLWDGFNQGKAMWERATDQGEKQAIGSVVEDTRQELLKFVPRPKLKERHFYNEELRTWVKVLIGEGGEVFFDAKQVCDLVGVSVEEAVKLLPKKDVIDLSGYEVVDEKS